MIIVSNVKDITGACNRKIRRDRIKFIWWSFTNNFEDIWDIISDDVNKIESNGSGLEKFIEICDNRLERSKAFLNEIAVVLGFDFVAISIIISIVDFEGKDGDPLLAILLDSSFGILFRVLVIFLIVIIIPLFILFGHYRSQIHAWTAFKEIALMKKA